VYVSQDILRTLTFACIEDGMLAAVSDHAPVMVEAVLAPGWQGTMAAADDDMASMTPEERMSAADLEGATWDMGKLTSTEVRADYTMHGEGVGRMSTTEEERRLHSIMQKRCEGKVVMKLLAKSTAIMDEIESLMLPEGSGQMQVVHRTERLRELYDNVPILQIPGHAAPVEIVEAERKTPAARTGAALDKLRGKPCGAWEHAFHLPTGRGVAGMWGKACERYKQTGMLIAGVIRRMKACEYLTGTYRWDKLSAAHSELRSLRKGCTTAAREAEAAAVAADAETARREEQRVHQHIQTAGKAAVAGGYRIDENEERERMQSPDTRYLEQDGHADMLALLETLEQNLVSAQKFDAWHPDKDEAQTKGKLTQLVAPRATGAQHDADWTRWWQSTQPYITTLHAWSMRAARAAKRRCVRATEDHRAHQFAMGEFGVFGRLLQLNGAQAQPQPHNIVRTPAGNIREARNDEERIVATAQEKQEYFAAPPLQPFAQEYMDAGRTMYRCDADWLGGDGPEAAAAAAREGTFQQKCKEARTNGNSEPEPDADEFIQVEAAAREAYRKVFPLLKPQVLDTDKAELLAWPFRARRDEDGGVVFSHPEVLDGMEATMRGTPGKARHRGYHMHIFARLTAPVRAALRRYLKLGLLLIMLPRDAQAITLVNIPKPVSGFRPLALAHDMYCMLTGVISSHLQTSLECAQIFMAMIAAYRPGRSGTQLISALLCGIEDARENGKTLFATLEDFEKFYDACSTDLILMSMHAHGLSETGYAQWVGESLRDRDMYVVTAIGTTGAVPRGCGYLQGSALSCVVVNFIVQILHVLWIEGGGAEGYGFAFDEALRLISASYSDDNNAYNDDLYNAIKSVELFGLFSIVTRIGRSTKQSHVLCFGLEEGVQSRISKYSEEKQQYINDRLRKKGTKWVIRTHAWSRVSGCVVMTEIPLVVKATPVRYLGLRKGTREGCKVHGQSMYAGARSRLTEVQKQVRCFPSFAYLYNSMVIPVFVWLALQGRASMVCAALLDRSAVATAKRLLRLHHSACAHEVWLPSERGFLGRGLRSAGQATLQEKAGALDVLMNDAGAPGHALAAERMRAAQRAAMVRWEAVMQREATTVHGEPWTMPLTDRVLECRKQGFVFAGVWTLARLGVYMRNREDELVGRTLDNLALLDANATVLGSRYPEEEHARAGDHIIGSGTLHSAQYMWGGVCEAMVLHGIREVGKMCETEGLQSRRARILLSQETTWTQCERYEVGMAKKVARAVRQAIARWQSDVCVAHSLQVWRAPSSQGIKPAEDAPYHNLNNYSHSGPPHAPYS